MIFKLHSLYKLQLHSIYYNNILFSKQNRTKMFHVYWPATAALTLLLIVGVIMWILKYGHRCLNLRHHTFNDDVEYAGGQAYEHRVAYEHDV